MVHRPRPPDSFRGRPESVPRMVGGERGLGSFYARHLAARSLAFLQGGLQHPQVAVAHDLAKMLLGHREGRRGIATPGWLTNQERGQSSFSVAVGGASLGSEAGFEAGNWPDRSAERAKRAAMPRKRGHDDLSLKCKGG